MEKRQHCLSQEETAERNPGEYCQYSVAHPAHSNCQFQQSIHCYMFGCSHSSFDPSPVGQGSLENHARREWLAKFAAVNILCALRFRLFSEYVEMEQMIRF